MGLKSVSSDDFLTTIKLSKKNSDIINTDTQFLLVTLLGIYPPVGEYSSFLIVFTINSMMFCYELEKKPLVRFNNFNYENLSNSIVI